MLNKYLQKGAKEAKREETKGRESGQSPQSLSRTSTNTRKETAPASSTWRVTTLRTSKRVSSEASWAEQSLQGSQAWVTHTPALEGLPAEWGEGRQTQNHNDPWQGNDSHKQVEFRSPHFPGLENSELSVPVHCIIHNKVEAIQMSTS